MSLLYRIVVFALLLTVAIYGGWYGSAGWDSAFINERVFSAPFGWVEWASLISWSFFLIFFFALGLLFAALFGPPYSVWWALALGCAYGFRYFRLSGHSFQPDANWATYFFAYGTYFMPALGAVAGAWFSTVLARGRARRVGA